MKKSIKNTIMIGMAAVLIGTSAVTISYARGNKGAQMMPPQIQSGQFENQQGNNPFGGFDQDQSGSNQNGNKSNRPQMPGNQQGGNSDSSQQPQAPGNQSSGDSNNQLPQAPNDQNSGGNTQQNSDNGSEKSSSEKSSSDSSTNTSLSVESLAAEDAAQSTEQNTAQKNLPSNGFNRKGTNVISALCYMFAALQIAIILAMLIYLIISKMNKISFNEVLANMRKKQ